MDTALTTKQEQPEQQPSTQGSSPGGEVQAGSGAQLKSYLKGASYEDGARALTPGGGGGPKGPVQMKTDGDPPTTELPTSETTGGDGGTGGVTTGVTEATGGSGGAGGVTTGVTETTGGSGGDGGAGGVTTGAPGVTETTGGSGGAGGVTTGTTTSSGPSGDTATTTTTQAPPGGPDAGADPGLVAATNDDQIDRLVEALKQISKPKIVRKGKQDVKKATKRTTLERDVFEVLAFWDSGTIVTAWNIVRTQRGCESEFWKFVKKLDPSNMASFPRETAATFEAMTPAQRLELAEDFVKTGFLNAVNKQEATGASIILKTLPEAEAEAFRKAHPEFDKKLGDDDKKALEGAKNPDEDAALKQRELERQAEYAASVEKAAGDSAETKDSSGTAPSALSVADALAKVEAELGVGPQAGFVALAGLATGGLSQKDFRALVQALDNNGRLAPMLDTLGFAFLWNTNSPFTQRILDARDPMKNLGAAQTLVEQKAKSFSAEEAYIAFRYLKAVPAGYRDTFRKVHRSGYDAMLAALNDSMKADLDLNFHASANTEGIRKQLDDERIWAPDNGVHLSGLLKVALAANMRPEVVELANKYKGFDVHAGILEGLGITADGADVQVETEDKEKLGLFGMLGEYNDLKRQTREEGGKFQNPISFGKKKLEYEGVELDEADDIMGGELAGVKFRDIDDATATEEEKKINTVDLQFDPINGYLNVRSPKIDIASLNFPLDDTFIKAGGAIVGDLQFTMTWPTKDNPGQDTAVLFDCGSFEVKDILVTAPDDIISITRVSAGGIHFRLADKPAGLDDKARREQAEAAFKNMQPVKHVIGQLIHTYRNTGGDLGAALGGALGGSGGVSLEVSDFGVEGFVSSSGAHVDAVKVEDVGVKLEQLPSRHVKLRLGQIPTMLAEKEARIAELEALAAREETEQHELDRLKGEVQGLMTERTTLEGKLAEKDAEGRTLEERETRYMALLDAKKTGALSEVEEAELAALRETMTGGMVIDLGGFEVQNAGLDGGSKVGSFKTGAVHGYGDTGVLGNDLVNGDAPTKVGGNMTLDLGDAEVSDVLMKGEIPDYRECLDRHRFLSEQLRSGGLIDAQRVELEVLNQDLTRVVYVDPDGREIVARDVMSRLIGMEDGRIPMDEKLYVEMRESLRDVKTVTHAEMHGLKVGVSGEGDLEGAQGKGKVSVALGEAKVTGVETQNVKADEVSLTGVDLSASTDGLGLKKGQGGTSALAGGGDMSLDVESLRAKGVDTGGVKVGEVGLEGLSIEGKLGEASALTLHVDRVYSRGVGIERVMTEAQKKLDALSIKESRTPREETELLQAEWMVAEYAHFTTEIANVTDGLADAKARLGKLVAEREEKQGKAGFDGAANQAAIDAVIGEMTLLKERAAELDKKLSKLEGVGVELGLFELKDLDVSVTGLGNPLAADWSMVGRTITLDVNLNGATLKALGLDMGETSLHAPEISASGASVNVSLTFDKVKRGGEEFVLPVSVLLNRLDIAKVSAGGLRVVQNVEGELVEIALPRADVSGIHAEGLDLANLDPATLTGSVKVDEIGVDLETRMGEAMSGRGSMDVKGLHLDALQSGEVNFGFGELTLDKLGFESVERAPKSKLVTQIMKMNGRVSKLGKASFEAGVNRKTGESFVDLDLSGITLTGIHYAGGGASLDVNGAARLGKTAARVKAQLDPAVLAAKMGADADTNPVAYQNPLQSLEVQSLTIADLSVSKVAYRGKTDVELGDGTRTAKTQVDLEKAYITGVNVTGVHLDKDLAMSSGKVQVGSAGLTGLEAHVRDKAGQEVFSGGGAANVSGLSVQLFKDGSLDAGFKSASLTDVHVESGDLGRVTGMDQLDGKDAYAKMDKLEARGFKFHQGKVFDPNTKKWIDQSEFSLDKIYADEMSAGVGGKEPGVGKGKAVSGFSATDIAGTTNANETTLDVGTFDATLTGNVEANQYHQAESEAGQTYYVMPKHQYDWDLGFVNDVSGHVGVMLPFTSDGININVPFPSIGQIMSGAAMMRGAIDKRRTDIIKAIRSEPFFNISWAAQLESRILGWCVDVAADAAVGVLEYVQDGLSQVQPYLEAKLNAMFSDPSLKTGGQATKEKLYDFKKEYDALQQSLVDQAVTKISSWGMLYDLAAPTWGSKGRLASELAYTVYDYTPDWVTFWQSSEDKQAQIDAHTKAAQAEREAEIAELTEGLITWAKDKLMHTGVDLGAKGQGSFGARRKAKEGPDQAWKPWLSSNAKADFKAKGSAADSVALNMVAGVSNFKYTDGGTSLEADFIQVSTGNKVGLSDDMNVSGSTNTTIHGSGISYSSKSSTKEQQEHDAEQQKKKAAGQDYETSDAKHYAVTPARIRGAMGGS